MRGLGTFKEIIPRNRVSFLWLWSAPVGGNPSAAVRLIALDLLSALKICCDRKMVEPRKPGPHQEVVDPGGGDPELEEGEGLMFSSRCPSGVTTLIAVVAEKLLFPPPPQFLYFFFISRVRERGLPLRVTFWT